MRIEKRYIIFIPTRVIFEKDSLNYDLGKNLYDYFSSKLDRNIFMYALIIPIHLNIITTIVPEKTPNIILYENTVGDCSCLFSFCKCDVSINYTVSFSKQSAGDYANLYKIFPLTFRVNISFVK